MYLTRLELDTAKRKTIMALAAPALFHGAVESAFTEKGGKLWRIDPLNGKTYLLLVSNERPDLSDASTQFGNGIGWETVDYTLFLNHIKDGDRRRFRLKANPVVTLSAGTGNRGKVLAHVTADQQESWLAERAERYGFSLMRDDFRVVESKWETFHKGTDGGKHITFRTAVFEGMLTVNSAEQFRETLRNGIGREKAYGCGLLTVTRCEK